MTRASGRVVAALSGTLLLAPVLGAIAGVLADASGMEPEVTTGTGLLVGLATAWIGSMLIARKLWPIAGPYRWTDRVFVTVVTLSIVLPPFALVILWGMFR